MAGRINFHKIQYFLAAAKRAIQQLEVTAEVVISSKGSGTKNSLHLQSTPYITIGDKPAKLSFSTQLSHWPH
jgi:hypothetical protein